MDESHDFEKKNQSEKEISSRLVQTGVYGPIGINRYRNMILDEEQKQQQLHNVNAKHCRFLKKLDWCIAHDCNVAHGKQTDASI